MEKVFHLKINDIGNRKKRRIKGMKKKMA